MTTDSILPLTVDSAMAATLEPLDDPMIDLESILLSGDASVHQTDLLSGLIETDEDFLNELLNPSSSSLSSSPNQLLTAHSSTCYYPSPTSSSPYSHQLQQDGSGSPYQVNAFTFTHSSPLSVSSIEQYSPTGCWSGEGHNNSPSLDSPLGTDVHINVEDISCPKDEATSSSSRKTGSLILSEEEKRLLAEEGIHLPTDMPLTKAEERHLKRIRRKIKNKQSAADSRKRKKEYVDGLEKRVERCTAENLKYKKKIDSLQSENKSLLSQLHKLQAIVSQYSPSKVQAGSFLMVFILSFSILIVPNLFGTHSDVASSNGVSRTLLNVEADEFGNVIDPISGKVVYDYISPVPLPPWKFQSPVVTN